MTEEGKRSSMSKKSPACLLQWEGEPQAGPANGHPRSPPAPSSKDKPESGPGEGEEKAAGPPRPHGPSRMPGRAGGGAVRRLPKKKPTPAPPDQTKASATRVPCIQLSFIGEIFNHRCQSSKSFLFSKHCKEKTLFLLISLLLFLSF